MRVLSAMATNALRFGQDMADSQLVKIRVGDDPFRADVNQAACADAGFRARLVRNEHPEMGRLIALQPSYLLVRAEDVQPVMAIVEWTYRRDTGSAEE